MVGCGRIRTGLVGVDGASEPVEKELRARCRLKFLKLPDALRTGDIVDVTVVKLSDLEAESGVPGVVVTVQTLLLRVLLPADEASEELLPLELSFRSLLKAPLLEIGGLDENEDLASCDCGAA